MQLLSCPAYSPVMSPIEHVRDLVGRRLARDPRPATPKDELLLRIQAIWNSLPQSDIQICLTLYHFNMAVTITRKNDKFIVINYYCSKEI
ncbi:UNVERIFIED_CONTAM: hypothetical protein NCL1_37135 [Trichonephila clavipes]